MKHLLMTSAAVVLGTGLAIAQTAPVQNSGPNPGVAPNTAPMPTQRPAMQGQGTQGQGVNQGSQGTGAQGRAVQGQPSSGPLPGANSFTENQARERIQNNGFANVTGLRKDDNGIWRGIATRNGAEVPVAVDYQGNVFQQ